LFASFTLDTPGAGEVSRRDFVRFCSMAAAAIGLGPLAAEDFVKAAERGAKPSVIWLQFQECTGCTESLLRTSHPGVDELILDLISLDYHETLFAAAGHQAEAVLREREVRVLAHQHRIAPGDEDDVRGGTGHYGVAGAHRHAGCRRLPVDKRGATNAGNALCPNVVDEKSGERP